MKKALILFVVLLVATSAFAFEKGTMNLGGTASLSMSKADSDDETTTAISLRPQFGYFVADNVCIDGIIIFESESYDDDSISAFGIGVGGRYFLNRIYGGLDFQYQSMTMDISPIDMNVTAMYIQPKLGVLLPLSSSVFADLGMRYQMGLGDYGGDGSGANESSTMAFSVGLQYFFRR